MTAQGASQGVSGPIYECHRRAGSCRNGLGASREKRSGEGLTWPREMPLLAVKGKDELAAALGGSGLTLCLWGATWSEPSKDMEDVVEALCEEHPSIRGVKADAEALAADAQASGVQAVPTVIIFRDGREVARVVGASAPELAAKVSELSSGPQAAESINDRIKKLLSSQKIMLFMKGSPDAPRCGFSRRVADLLRQTGKPFGHFDILRDQDVRQGLKEYSNWPTYPQLYVDGELVGGCDIIEQLAEAGELGATLEGAS